MTTTHTPRRIRRERTPGWRAPLDPQGRAAVYVGCGSRWGNPWVVAATSTGTGWAVSWAGHADQHKPLGINGTVPASSQRDAHALAVELYEVWFHRHPQLAERSISALAGRDLMCWCAPALPCHADVLLALAAAATPGTNNGGVA